MNQLVKCTTKEETLKAIKEGDIPEIYEDFAIDVRQKCRLIVREGAPSIRALGKGSIDIEVCGSSAPNIEVCGSSKPLIRIYDSSKPFIRNKYHSAPTIQTFGSNKPVILTYDFSHPLIETHDSSKPLIKTYASGYPLIRTYHSSAPAIYLYGKTSNTNVYGSSSPLICVGDSNLHYIKTYDSSRPMVEVHGSGIPSLESFDSSKPFIKGNAKVACGKTSTIRIYGQETPQENITGEGQVILLDSDRPTDWVNFFELPIADEEYVYLFKALDENFCANFNKFEYLPGTTPEAPDWNPILECGGGLHFSPSPRMAGLFYERAKKFTACKVKISEIVVHPNGLYPEKVKAPRVYEVFEVDLSGNHINLTTPPA